jgi:hypothetical protein
MFLLLLLFSVPTIANRQEVWQAQNFQNLVHIIMSNARYIEPILGKIEPGCQGGDTYNGLL